MNIAGRAIVLWPCEDISGTAGRNQRSQLADTARPLAVLSGRAQNKLKNVSMYVYGIPDHLVIVVVGLGSDQIEQI